MKKTLHYTLHLLVFYFSCFVNGIIYQNKNFIVIELFKILLFFELLCFKVLNSYT